MRLIRSSFAAFALPATAILAACLAGCGAAPLSTVSPATAVTITGSVHGGQQPVVGAHVYILQVSGYGYGGQSIDAIGQQFLNTPYPAGVTYDPQMGEYYLTTDAQGNFSITGNYRCTDNRPLYLLATQGNPGLPAGKTNPALAEMAVLGTCPAGTTLPSTINLAVNELTTVAGVSALSGYMTAPNFVSAKSNPNGGASPSDTGVNNAALTALSLLNPSSGVLLSTTAAGGTVPALKIDLLADILAACINSDGTGVACTTLFANATADGTPSGTAPTDTVTAMLNIAHHPAANVAILWGLATVDARYQPMPVSVPVNFSLPVTFPIQYSANPTGSPVQTVALNPNLPTIDAAGDIIVPGVVNSGGTLAGATQIFNNLGQVIAGNNPSTTTVPFAVNKWAIDQQGNGWAAPTAVQRSPAFFARLTPASGAITTYPQTLVPTTAYDSAIDTNGNVYFPNSVSSQVVEYSSSGAPVNSLSTGSLGIAIESSNILYDTTSSPDTIYFGNAQPVTGGGLSNPSLLAADNSENVWVANANSTLSKFSLTSSMTLVSVSPSSGFTGGGMAFQPSAQPYIQVVMDGLSNAWVPNYAGKSISAISSAGVPLSPGAGQGFSGGFPTGCNSKGMAIDGSGNVWVTCDNPGYSVNAQSLIEFIGLAAPVATPILPNQTGTRPLDQ